MNGLMMKTENEHRNWRLPWVPFVLSMIMLIAFAVVFELLPVEPVIDSLQELIDQAGPIGPLLFVILFAAAVVFPPLSNRPFVLSAGLLFGVWFGAALTVLGATLGASVNFWIARKYGQQWISNHPALRKSVDKIEPLGTWYVIFLTRMFAGFTFDWYSYLLGIIGTRWPVFISATALGITPGVIAEVYAGSFLVKNAWISVLIGFAITTISLLVYRASHKLRSIDDVSKLLRPRELMPPKRRADSGTKRDIED